MFYIPMLLVQVACAVHAYRTGRPFFWMYIILLFPGVGVLIYLCAEVLPNLLHSPGTTKARQKLQKAIDPDRELRDARYALETTPTVANRIRLAEAQMTKRDYDGVIATLQPALVSHFSGDAVLLEGLAQAYYAKGDAGQALTYVDKIYEEEGAAPKAAIRLLRAKLLQAVGNPATAQEELAALLKSSPSEEARIALAQVHETQGAKDEARAIYEDIVRRYAHAPKRLQAQQRAWIDSAKTSLRKL